MEVSEVIQVGGRIQFFVTVEPDFPFACLLLVRVIRAHHVLCFVITSTSTQQGHPALLVLLTQSELPSATLSAFMGYVTFDQLDNMKVPCAVQCSVGTVLCKTPSLWSTASSY